MEQDSIVQKTVEAAARVEVNPPGLTDEDIATLEAARRAALDVIDGPARDGGSVATIDKRLRGELSSRAKWFLAALEKAQCHARLPRS
jgi:hypothetical protein